LKSISKRRLVTPPGMHFSILGVLERKEIELLCKTDFVSVSLVNCTLTEELADCIKRNHIVSLDVGQVQDDSRLLDSIICLPSIKSLSIRNVVSTITTSALSPSLELLSITGGEIKLSEFYELLRKPSVAEFSLTLSRIRTDCGLATQLCEAIETLDLSGSKFDEGILDGVCFSDRLRLASFLFTDIDLDSIERFQLRHPKTEIWWKSE